MNKADLVFDAASLPWDDRWQAGPAGEGEHPKMKKIEFLFGPSPDQWLAAERAFRHGLGARLMVA